MGAGIQVSDECAEPAGVAGYRVAEVQDRDLRERLLLAWAQGLQELYCAEDEHGVLGGEGCPEPGAGPGGLEDVGGEGLERGHCLGLRAEEGAAGCHRGPGLRRDSPQRGTLSGVSGGSTEGPRGVPAGAAGPEGTGSSVARQFEKICKSLKNFHIFCESACFIFP